MHKLLSRTFALLALVAVLPAAAFAYVFSLSIFGRARYE